MAARRRRNLCGIRDGVVHEKGGLKAGVTHVTQPLGRRAGVVPAAHQINDLVAEGGRGVIGWQRVLTKYRKPLCVTIHIYNQVVCALHQLRLYMSVVGLKRE